MQNFKCLSFTGNGPIWTLKIERPEALNALSALVLEEISEVIREIKRMDLNKCRVVLVTGAGEKAFVAGADLKEIEAMRETRDAQAFAEKGQAVFRELERLFVPLIAVVNGFALGGGLELALACDFIVASEKAMLGLPEVGLGLIPGFGGTVRLARAVGLQRAREMIFLGEPVKADEALRMNLVSKVYPPEQLQEAALKLAETLAGRGPLAIALAKRTILKAYDQDVDTALRSEAKSFGELFQYADTKEGVRSFIEKRKPQFSAK